MSEKPAKLLRWFDPTRKLYAFLDGPRAGEWAFTDRWMEEVRLATLSTGSAPDRTLRYFATKETVTHPHDDRIVGTVMKWIP